MLARSQSLNLFSILFIASSFFLTISCKKKTRLSITDLEKATSAKIQKITLQKRYKLMAKGLQDTYFVEMASENQLIVVDQALTNPKVIFVKKFAKVWQALALKFINPGLEYSHLFLVLKNAKTNKYLLLLKATDGFEQSFDLTKKQLKTLFIYKNPKRVGEEYIEIGGLSYRFDSFNYIETILEMPLFYLEKIVFSNEDSWVILNNKGGFSGRAYVSLSFPELTSSNMYESVGLPKRINTVKLYRPGKQLYSATRVYQAAKYPTIEITKQPFNAGSKMRLPLKLLRKAGKMLLRVSYNYRGTMMSWPAKSELKKKNIKIMQDQQGFPAYIIDLKKYK